MNLILFILIPSSLSLYINPSCDFYQEMVPGQEYFIYNTEYPGSYRPSTSCRWTARSPPNTVIVLSCNEINIPVSQNCQYDKLAISFTGSQDFTDSRSFCGKNAFTVFSQRNFLTVGLFSDGRSPGGSFVCSVAAMRVGSNLCTCGMQPVHEEGKIVGGRNSLKYEYPWMVALVLQVSRYYPFCGGAIISDRYAVTAAHCLFNHQPQELFLLVGAHDLRRLSGYEGSRFYYLAQFIKHPRYDSSDENNDIALVKTAIPIIFNTAVGPVCLPFFYGTWNFENWKVTVLGFGFKDVGGDKAEVLQKVNLTVVPNTYCEQSLKQQIRPTQICTYESGKDSCNSDSGGPLLWKDPRDRRNELVGLVSFGQACATKVPAVNTRVTAFLSWIVSASSDAYYCIR